MSEEIDYDDRMNDLADKISQCADGENSFDFALVCARLIVYALQCCYNGDEEDETEKKEFAFNEIIEFMRADYRRITDSKSHYEMRH